ncbi:MAG: SMP-30/gluconolactonase/LRE family protein [Cyanobacteria bacterium P01_F01_bin.53]
MTIKLISYPLITALVGLLQANYSPASGNAIPRIAEAQSNVQADVQVETIAEYPSGTFLENLTVTKSGDVVFTSYFDKQILRLSSDGPIEVFAELSDHPISILEIENGFIVTVQATSFLEVPAFTETNAIVMLDSNGSVTSRTAAPQAKFLNGLHRLPSGEVLAADSMAATLWQVDPESGELSSWLSDPLLAPDPAMEIFLPGANGIKSDTETLYVSNSSRGAIYRLDLTAPNELELFAQTGAVDDFTIDPEGAIFATTHGEQLLKISPDGEVSVVLSSGCGGCTSIDFWPDEQSLIVINDGNFYEGGSEPARVFRVTDF